MDGGIEQPFPPALRRLSVARVLLDVRNEPRVEDRFPIVSRIESAIQVEVRTIDFQARDPGDARWCMEKLKAGSHSLGSRSI